MDRHLDLPVDLLDLRERHRVSLDVRPLRDSLRGLDSVCALGFICGNVRVLAIILHVLSIILHVLSVILHVLSVILHVLFVILHVLFVILHVLFVILLLHVATFIHGLVLLLVNRLLHGPIICVD